MGSFNIIFTVSFLLALMFSHAIMFAEGRLLEKKETNKKCENHVVTYEVGKDSGDGRVNSHRNILEIGAFDEPTPSVSLKVSPKSVFPLPPPGQSTTFASFWAETNDFRPTEPGHSPGAGHSKGPSSEGPN